MPLLGAHESISGGSYKALYRAKEKGFDVIQIFTRFRTRWSAKELSEKEITSFQKAREETGILPVSIHGSYLLNLASPHIEDREKAIDLCATEILWAWQLGIPYLVVHPGYHKGEGEEKGIELIADSLKKVFSKTSETNISILLETTSGQGTSLGNSFDQLKAIMDLSQKSDRLGVCLDTCHIFSAGYNISSKEAYGQTINEFDSVVGIDKLKVFHINDSKTERGSSIDRHAHLGVGKIGLEGLSFFLNDKRFVNHPFLLETAKGVNDEGVEMDIINLNILRELQGRNN